MIPDFGDRRRATEIDEAGRDRASRRPRGDDPGILEEQGSVRQVRKPAGENQVEDGLELNALPSVQRRQITPAAGASGGLELVRRVDDALHAAAEFARVYAIQNSEDDRGDTLFALVAGLGVDYAADCLPILARQHRKGRRRPTR